jgi:L-lactate dehydrogenase complex protein LldG
VSPADRDAAREAILSAVGRAAVPAEPLPSVPSAPAAPPASEQLEMPLRRARSADDLLGAFTAALEQAGGTAVVLDGVAALSLSPPALGSRREVVSCIPGFPVSTITVGPDTPRARLDRIGIAVVPGRLGVAENGAVWVDGRDLPHRAVPVIAEQLVVVLPKREIVADLHEAYRRIRPPLPAYGVFIAGPSKTADIAQALVIGAQGPRSLVVALT